MNFKIIPFMPVLGLIKDLRLRNYARAVVTNLPSYFFEIPASSSGKYHSENDRKFGGLVYHTKACVFMLLDMHRTKVLNLSEYDVDLGIIALLAHDGLKNGEENSERTLANHPLLASKFIEDLHIEDKNNLTDYERNIVCKAIERHSGQWVNDYNGKKILEEPQTALEKAVHLADYFSSRKHIEIQLDKVDVSSYIN